MICCMCDNIVTENDIALCQSVGFSNIYCESCFSAGSKRLLDTIYNRDREIKDGTFEQPDRHDMEKGE